MMTKAKIDAAIDAVDPQYLYTINPHLPEVPVDTRLMVGRVKALRRCPKARRLLTAVHYLVCLTGRLDGEVPLVVLSHWLWGARRPANWRRQLADAVARAKAASAVDGTDAMDMDVGRDTATYAVSTAFLGELAVMYSDRDQKLTLVAKERVPRRQDLPQQTARAEEDRLFRLAGLQRGPQRSHPRPPQGAVDPHPRLVEDAEGRPRPVRAAPPRPAPRRRAAAARRHRQRVGERADAELRRRRRSHPPVPQGRRPRLPATGPGRRLRRLRRQQRAGPPRGRGGRARRTRLPVGHVGAADRRDPHPVPAQASGRFPRAGSRHRRRRQAEPHVRPGGVTGGGRPRAGGRARPRLHAGRVQGTLGRVGRLETVPRRP